jgi:hypothetical protein
LPSHNPIRWASDWLLEKFIFEHLTEFMEFSRKYTEEEKLEKETPGSNLFFLSFFLFFFPYS